MKKEVRFAGFGGQGIALAGYIFGKAASIHAGLNAAMTQNYGPESRGGASAADVVISDTEIGYPAVTRPDILVVMSQEAFQTYGRDISPGSVLIYDGDMVQVGSGLKCPHYSVPFVKGADELGKKIVANIVMLGGFTAISKIIPKEAMKEAILSSVPAKFKDLNAKAFEKGFEAGMKVMAGR